MPELSPARLKQLTDRIQKRAQVRQLQALGIRYGERADGTLVVLEEEVSRVLYGGGSTIRTKELEPDWGAI